MIFIPSKKVGREAQAAMASAGWDIPLFHSGLDKLERDRSSESLQRSHRSTAERADHDKRVLNGRGHRRRAPRRSLATPRISRGLSAGSAAPGRDGKPALALALTRGDKEAR